MERVVQDVCAQFRSAGALDATVDEIERRLREIELGA